MEPPEQHSGGEPTLTLRPGCRALRRALGVAAWAVLEDVAMDAMATAHGLVATPSARRVAEHLGVTPGTAATALRRLRQRGLLDHERVAGPDGRFGLSVYRVHLVDGMALRPCVEPPSTGTPHVVNRHVAPDKQPKGHRPGRHLAENTSQLTLLDCVEESRD